jgi:chromosome segregation ATPase
MDASFDRRLPLYTYLRPLLAGRRVLELGTGGGGAALEKLGASAVASSPAPRPEHHGRAEVVIVSDATALVRGEAAFDLAAVSRLLAPGGFLVCVADSADRRDARGGVGYYDLHDALAAQFASVRMFGQTPFAAVGVAEFDGAIGGLQVDSSLIDPETEEPSHYVAIAGSEAGPALGYGLVQIPVSALAPREASKPPRAPSARDVAVASGGDAELRRRASEAEGRAEGLARANRAQSEELEELRGRLRRAAEARAELDEEVARLRRALAEADESVLNLTRRTTEEFAALAQRLTSGIRGATTTVEDARSPELAAVLERLREREAALARRESELTERDERIAALEAEKQELAWRAQQAEERLAEGPAAPRFAGSAASAAEVELREALAARDRALEEFRRAAIAHVDDTARLRSAVAEQETLVAELEESLESSEDRRTVAEREADRLRRALAEAEDADRARRSRLAELEGRLLRLQRETAMAQAREQSREPDSAAGVAPAPVDDGARRRVVELEQRLAALEAALQDEGERREDAERKWADAVDRMTGIEVEAAAERRELVRDREALQAQVVALAASGGQAPALRVAEQDVTRLRTALEKSEEALQQARAQIFPLRGRIATLEQALAARDAAERSLVARLLDELVAIEAGLRSEAAALGDVEGALDALAAAGGAATAPAAEPFRP